MAETQPHPCSNAALRRATRRLGQLYDDALAPTGLKATQFGLMGQIRLLDRPSMGELAAAMVMDLSALGHTLRPLTRDGLVALVVDPRDRRSRRVALTEAGEARFRAAFRLWRGAQARFEATLGTEKALLLRTLLDEIAAPPFAAAFAAPGSDPAGPDPDRASER
ncbi:MarR family winged helix-turn-helix transcriptional regulator [uncultured Methylobacterium sp.]|uniref:MarR family winged helix-turn-helix transcriptional regulator n=1 Tax=uncultured Methylobacterium sp. TaxID=157278 RepID=UPI002613DDA9|nr:MarR family winged helix-turn-helix transcriptional regulator [uncultured Methylobacterium sp.]